MILTNQPREWHSLGLALKALRTARDLGQKEVIDRAGEEMGERTVRGYERGEQRPSRERLLRLALRSFGLKDPAEIDRRRPGRIHAVSPALIPLLRKAGAIAGDLFPINSLHLVALWAASAYPANVWRSMSATERSTAIDHETLEMNERLALVH